MTNEKREFWLILLAFLIMYVVWGSTYLANAWGVKVVPPFLFSGARFLAAGFLLLGILSLFQPIRISKQQLKNTLFAGFMLFAIGNGLVVWALQYVDSGLTALLVAGQPLIVALMLWKLKNEKPNRDTWLGITLGVIGMYLLVGQPEFTGSREFFMGVFAVLAALFSWGYVSIWLPEADMPSSVLQSASWQMIMGGIIMMIVSGLLGENSNFKTEELNSTIYWAFAYLVIFGSIAAFSSFTYLLQKVSPTKVVTSAYVNPVIAVFLGWWLNDENLTGRTLVAAAILLTGVVFINRAKSKVKAKT